MKKFLIIVSGLYLTCVGLLFSLGCIAGYILLHQKAASLPKTFPSVLLLALYLPMAAVIGATGVCVMMKKNWARYSVFVMSIFALFVGLMTMVVFAVMPSSALSKPGSGAARVISMLITGFFFIVIPACFMVFFSRKSVAGLFRSGTDGKVRSPRPLGVTLVCLHFLLGCLMLFIYAVTPFYRNIPIQVGGIMLSGLPVKITYLVLAAISCYLGIGLWRLKKHAWAGALIYQAVILVVGILNVLMLSESIVQRLSAAAAAFSTPGHPSLPLSLNYFRAVYGVSLLVVAVVMVYLYVKKTVFAGKTDAALPAS